MKTKLMAIVLCILMLVQPTMAIGMVGMESAEEVVAVIPEVQEEEIPAAEVMAAGEYADNVLFFDDFEGYEVEGLHEEGTSTSLTPAYRADGVTATIGTTDRSTVTVDGVEYKSNPYWQIIEENGDKVLFITQGNSNYNNAGFDFNNLYFKDPGVYTVSFDLKEELGTNATGICAQNSSGGYNDATWMQHEIKNAEGAASGFGLTNSGINATNAMANLGNWFNVQYQYIVKDNGDGTRSINVKSNRNGWNPPAATLNEGEYLSRIRHYLSFQPAKIAQGKIYVDDIKLTYDPYATVTYVDTNGNQLYKTENALGSVAFATKAELGVDFYPAYFVNGEEVISSTLNLVGLGDEVEVVVKPNVRLFYEDFEGFAINEALKVPYTAETPSWTRATLNGAYRREGRTEYIRSGDESCNTDVTPNVYSNQQWIVVEQADGNKVLKITAERGKWNSAGLQFLAFDLSKAGVYHLSFDLAAVDYEGSTWGDGKGTNPGEFGQIKTGLSEDSMDYMHVAYTIVAADNGDGTFTYTISSIVTHGENAEVKSESKKYENVAPQSNVNSWLCFGTSGNGTVEVYVDNIEFVQGETVTLKYVDEKGTTIKTAVTSQGAKIGLSGKTYLGTAYIPGYKIGNTTYMCGDVITVPSDATGEYVITVTKKPFPANAPDNAIIFEDFENKVIGDSADVDVAISYVADDANINGKVGDYSVAGNISSIFDADPKNAANKTMKVTSVARYDNGMIFGDLNITEVGKYLVSWDFYTEADFDVHTNCSNFSRVFYIDTEGNSTFVEMPHVGTNSFNTADKRNTWVTKQNSFEITEENGKKYLKAGNNNIEIQKVHRFELYMECPTATETDPYIVWFDNAYVAREALETITATFVDENNEAFDFEGTTATFTHSYVLPTADDMGVDYLVEFVGEDGNVYYPGTSYKLEKGKTSAEFTVRKTNVVFYEDFDNKSKANAWLDATYAAGPMAGATVIANNINNNVNGTNSHVLSYANADVNKTPDFIKVNLTQPGIYKITMDAELLLEKKAETDLVDNNFYVNCQVIGSWNSTGGNVWLREGELKKTVSGYIELFEDTDGTIKYRLGSHEGAVRETAIGQIRTGLIWANDFLESTEQKATYHMSFDNIKVEYTPMAPVNTGKASYRPMDDNGMGGPEGIRFAAYVEDGQREIASEYGFVVTRKTLLGDDYSKLNLSGIDSVSATQTTSGTNEDGVKVVAGAAYIKDVADKVYIKDGKVFGLQGLYETFFTGVLCGLDDDTKKADIFVARPYAKVDGVYYYGDCHETSYNEVKTAAETANA